MSSHRRGSSSRYLNDFSLSAADFERDSVLKRRRQPSAELAVVPPANDDGGIRMRVRSKSKSRARSSATATLRRIPSLDGHEFYPLGRTDRPVVSRSATAPSVVAPMSSGRSTRSMSRARLSAPTPKPDEDRSRKREREQSVARRKSEHSSTSRKSRDPYPVKPTTSSRHSRTRSKSTSRRTRHRSSSSSESDHERRRRRSKEPSKSRGRERSKSTTRQKDPVTSISDVPRRSKSKPRTTDDDELQREIDSAERKIRDAQKELADIDEEMTELQRRKDACNYEIMDLQIVMDGLKKRRELQRKYLNGASAETTGTSSHGPSEPPRKNGVDDGSHLGSKRRTSKRPRIDDDEEDDDDDDVVIVEPPHVKPEPPQRSTHGRSKARAMEQPPVTRALTTANSEQMTDYFWGRVEIAKLLVQPRIRSFPDLSARKGRHLAFNPMDQNILATSSDDGGLILWGYSRSSQEINRVVSFAPTSLRKDSQCAESIAWSPNGDRLAIAFRDPVDGLGEFCVVRLHQLALTDSQDPQMLPKDRVKSKSTTLHPRGISAIEWVPSGYGDNIGSRGLITAGSDHAVVLWEEAEDMKNVAKYKWRMLHQEHRSDVRTICMHSQRTSVLTGGLDGLVVRYDMHAHKPQIIMERRRPNISKINAVLENPHNPNLLLVSSVEPSEHNLLLHDLRQKYDANTTMTLSWMRSTDAKSMSQYIVPRWSPGGFHVSCGSTTGLVNIWDVRVRGPKFPLVHPQQSISVHQKQVLHATWHPRYDAMFSVSHDRTIGLLTFR